MKRYPPEIQQKLDRYRDSLLDALASAFVRHFGEGKLVKQEPITEFDYECRWWMVEVAADIPTTVEIVKTVDRSIYQPASMTAYSTMTSLPADKAMLSLTVDGDEIEIAFMPRAIQRPQKEKPKGFGK